MKKAIVLLLCGWAAAAALAGQDGPVQTAAHFYNVDKEVRVEGTVQEIRFEPRYKDGAPFLILVLQGPAEAAYFVEVGPSWFFGQDLHKGEPMTIVGSLAGERTVIARQLRFRGETVVVRDKKGFPSWSRGKSNMRGKRRIGGF